MIRIIQWLAAIAFLVGGVLLLCTPSSAQILHF
jgi:hypothetical protein